MCIYAHACARRYVAGHGIGAATMLYRAAATSMQSVHCQTRETGATARQTRSLRSGALHEGAHTLAGIARLICCSTKSCHNGTRRRLRPRPLLSRVLPRLHREGATQRSAPPCRERMVGSGRDARCSWQLATRRGLGRPVTATAPPWPGQLQSRAADESAWTKRAHELRKYSCPSLSVDCLFFKVTEPSSVPYRTLPTSLLVVYF
jgi:hypothetical protein